MTGSNTSEPRAANRHLGSRAKIARAKHHLESLDRDIAGFLEGRPFRVTVDCISDGTLHIARLEHGPQPPFDRWAVIIGDCVHNLRSALDYVAWELAGSHDSDSETLFPIFDTLEDWNRKSRRRTKRLSAHVVGLIESMQPFRSATPSLSALSALRRVSDADKHKLLTVSAAVQGGFHCEFESDGEKPVAPERILLLPDTPLVGGAVVATIVFPSEHAALQVSASITPVIVFGDASYLGERLAIVPSLAEMMTEVEAVVDFFEKKALDDENR